MPRRGVETGGAVDSIYTDGSRRLGGFIAALVALLRSLPVLHRYDALVAEGQAAKPRAWTGPSAQPPPAAIPQLVTAFATYRRSILLYMYDSR